MKSQIRKWGNSAAVRIPAPILDGAGLRLDQAVEIRQSGGCVVIAPARVAGIDIDDLVRRITPRNRHEFVDIGGPVGLEVD